MEHYRLREPAPAMQYLRGGNEAEIAALIMQDDRGSFSNARGHLEVFNLDGQPDRRIESGQWVVRVAGSILVLDENEFHTLFTTG